MGTQIYIDGSPNQKSLLGFLTEKSANEAFWEEIWYSTLDFMEMSLSS